MIALPTHSLIKIKDIKNSVIILENGGLRSVLTVSGINFGLLSEAEQDIVIGQFKSFLDGLDFPIQILIVSRLENIQNYLKILHLKLETEINPLIKFQLEEYISFLEDYTTNNKILQKRFYIVVPYDPLSASLGPLGKLQKKESQTESFKVQLEQLESRIIYVTHTLSTIGLMIRRLEDEEILELLYELYNPNLKWGQIPKPIIEKLLSLT